MDLELSARISQITEILKEWAEEENQQSERKNDISETKIAEQAVQMEQIIVQLKELEESLSGRIQANSK